MYHGMKRGIEAHVAFEHCSICIASNNHLHFVD